MKRILFALIFLSTVTLNAQLQEKFNKGWIIDSNNNKIDGFIKADDLAKMSSSICFKKNLEEQNCTNYDTTQLKSFKTTDVNTFDLLQVKMNKNKDKITVFANLIVKASKLSLYKSVYKTEMFFILVKGDELFVLQNDKLVS